MLRIAIDSRQHKSPAGVRHTSLPAQGVPVSEERTSEVNCVTLHFGPKTKGCFLFLTILENLFLSYCNSEGFGVGGEGDQSSVLKSKKKGQSLSFA